jgi:hypothetical protein
MAYKLRKKLHDTPFMIHTVAGGHRYAISTRIRSDDLTAAAAATEE